MESVSMQLLADLSYKRSWDRLLPGDLQEKFDMKKKVPLRRVGEHQELANLAAYLVSDYSLI
jgi:hypothetical protein